MDLTVQIQETANKIIAEKMPSIIENKVEKMLESIIEDTFRSYGDFAKAIKEKIQEELDISLIKFDLVDYNALVAQTIKNELNGVVEIESLEPIKKLVRSVTGRMEKKEMKLSEVIDHFMSLVAEDAYENSGEVSIHVIENAEQKWHTVSLDLEPNQSPEKCAIEFLIHSDQEIFIFRLKTTWQYNKSKINPVKATQLKAIEHYLYRLYSGQVKIEIDETYFETEWNKYDGY